MRNTIDFIICVLISIALYSFGYHFLTWQYWVFGVPLIILYKYVGDKLFQKIKDE